jgi:hypothetical protein
MNSNELCVLQAQSLRDLVERVNAMGNIYKEDIVSLLHEDGCYFLLYFKYCP